MILFGDQLIHKDECAVSPDDRGYYFGDGVYEVFRVYNGKMFEAEGHYQRLAHSTKEVRIELPYSLEELDAKLHELIAINNLQEGILYMQVTRGAAPRVHAIPAGIKPSLMAYTSELPRPFQSMKDGIRAITQEDIRWLRCDIKSLNLLPNVLAKQNALDQGVQEVIMHRNGTVTECSASNLMMVKDGTIFTHPANNLILHGITRAFVLRLANELQIPIVEQAFTTEQLLHADEAFITGTTSEVTPIIEVDGHPIGRGIPGEVARRLQDEFNKHIPFA